MDKNKLAFYSFLFLAGGCGYGAFILSQSRSPVYWWFLVPAAIFAILGYGEHRRLDKVKLLTKLRRAWGEKEQKRERDFSEIAYLFQNAARPETACDDRTWHDLNMDLVFARIDRTFTWPGIQSLYQMLRLPQINSPDRLQKRNEFITFFQNNRKEREKIQMILSRADIRIGSGLALLLWDPPDLKPLHPPFLYRLLSIAALLSSLLLILGPRYVFLLLVVFQLNMYLHFRVQREIKAHFEGVRSLRQLVAIGKKLAAVDCGELEELLQEIRDSVGKVKRFSQLVRAVGLETADPILNTVQQYYTIFFLAEVRGFFRALDFIKENRTALQALFLGVGEIDSFQSVASFRESLPYYCRPTFANQRQLKLEEAYHLLLENPVANSINTAEQGILITGSNMSGKSTFLRTVGLNVLLAQTIVSCPAKSYQACPLLLLTSIGRADNVVEGKSYYLEEALSVLRVLRALEQKFVVLAIFDEIFRGTNSEERIFAAQRVLQYLIAKEALVFVATHDLELVELLTAGYTARHFSEKVGHLGLEFDYKLKEGPATTRNAIALLRFLEYPAEITEQDGI